MKNLLRILCCVSVWVSGTCTLLASDWSFALRFDESVRKEPYTGRVYLFFSRGNQEPRLGPNWFGPEPFTSKEVANLAPGKTVTLAATDENLLFYPDKPREFDPREYRVQAVMRFNPWEREVGSGAGNGYSKVQLVPLVSKEADELSFVVDRIAAEPEFVESDSVKLCAVESPLMSKFYGHKVSLKAAVMLPAEYQTQPERKFPTLFIIPGFGGTYFDHPQYARLYSNSNSSLPMIRVLLDPACPEGHHVFADSDVNGPWGTALVEEFLPGFETQFRAIPHREARYLTGHSSGGWSSLWVMVTHPETFAATWSTSPDPVTFQDFQRIDMYAANENMYRDRHHERRPLARINGQVALWYDDFDRMEVVLGHGGQLRSFEAVFGSRQADGSPMPAWDRASGAVDTKAVEHWEQYDIVHKLKSEWDTLKPKLSGRLHVHMGEEDTFYLEGATRILQAALKDLGEPNAVTMHPGRTHFDLLSPPMRLQIYSEIRSHYEKYFEPDGALRKDVK
jgi:S-formylglutathione hydrolase FrmB